MMAAVLLVGGLVVVPGAGASLALAPPGAITVEGRIGLVFGLGYGVVAGVATALALAHVFSRPAFIVGVILATIGVWLLALRRAPAREHAAKLAEQARETPFVLGAGLALLLAVAVSRLFYPSENSLAIRSAWRYWSDGLEAASAGHVPTTAAQWGIEMPATISKLVLNNFEGGVSYFLGPQPLPAMHGILTITAIGVAAALLGLARELGLTMTAPLVPVLVSLVPDQLPLSHEVSRDLKLYTGEGVGRLAAFSAVIAGIYALRSRERLAPPIVAGVLLALAGLTHLVPTLIAGALIALFAIAVVLVDRTRFRVALVRGVVAALTFAVCYAGITTLSGGDLGLQRATSHARFAGLPSNVDPTVSFSHGRYVDLKTKHGHFFVPPREIVALYAQDTIDRPDYGKAGFAFLVLLFIASAIAAWFERRLFIVLAVAWGLAGTILAVAVFFSFRYDTVIPAVFGVRRLYDYAVLPTALVIPALIEAAAAPFARRNRFVVSAVAVAAAAVAVTAAIVRIPGDQKLQRANAGKQVFASVARHVPCGARMLANARTAGSWEAWTGRGAITEGMAPYLRPEVMGRILPILVGANDFFKAPRAHQDYLAKERIQYLVVVSPGIWFGWGSTGRNPQPDDAEWIAALPGVSQVYRDQRVAIFAVGRQPVVPAQDLPARCPV